ncbi:MAG: aldo/keto reductase [Planctomycetia bacterium]|nr:aldo/keto reductase [Planctomycetia bacterium]
MEKRSFKTTEKKISLLGFGTMRLPVINTETQEIDLPQAEEMFDNALKNGVNYFDTAFPYHNGMSETVVGNILANYPRDSFYLADKMPIWDVQSPDDVAKIFQKQLEKCRVDYFDFYLLHNISLRKMPKIEAMKAYEYLAEQKKSGKIRQLGFSFHDSSDALKNIVNRYDWDFAQIQLNYLDWELLDAQGQYNILTEHELPIAIMEPIRGGALATLCPEAIAILKEADPEKSPASWALRYAASLPNVYTVLSGMSNLEQLADNIQTFHHFQPLTSAEQNVLSKALDAYRKASPIPCTACRYCMDCPNGVDIPKNFAIYNRYLTTSNIIEFISSYIVLEESKRAKHCVECGLCQEKCPQKLNIPELMPKIDNAFQKIEKPQWFA